MFKPKNKQFTLVSRYAVLALLTLALAFPATTSAQVDPIATMSVDQLTSATSSTSSSSVMSPDNLFSPLVDAGMSEQNSMRSDEVARLDSYFSKWNMPLAGYGNAFVAASEKCGLDWRLLPAISVRESSGGKHLMNNNPFGWGSAQIKFKDFSEAIDVVSDNLCGLNDATATYYKDKTTLQKLWNYNGSVEHQYPGQVLAIMNMF